MSALRSRSRSGSASSIKQCDGGDNPMILYIGDADKTGLEIDRQIVADFSQTHHVDIDLRRIALTPADVVERGDTAAEVNPEIRELPDR